MSEPRLHTALAGVLGALHELGVPTLEDGKVLGGVALAQPYYAAALYAEGAAASGPAADPRACSVLLACGGGGSGVGEDAGAACNADVPLITDDTAAPRLRLVPATYAQMAAGGPELPFGAPVLGQLLSPAAITSFHWARPPGVLIYGRFPPGLHAPAAQGGGGAAEGADRDAHSTAPAGSSSYATVEGSAAADEEAAAEAAAEAQAAAEEAQIAAMGRAEAAGARVSAPMGGPYAEERLTQLTVWLKQAGNTYPGAQAFLLTDVGFLVAGDTLEEAAAAFDACIRPYFVADPPSSAAGGAMHDHAAPRGIGGLLLRLGGLFSRASDGAAEAGSSAGAAADAAPIGAPLLAGAASASGGEVPLGGALQAARRDFRRTSSLAAAVEDAKASTPGALAAAGSGCGAPAAGVTAVVGGEALPDDIRAAPGSKRLEGEHVAMPTFATGMRPW